MSCVSTRVPYAHVPSRCVLSHRPGARAVSKTAARRPSRSGTKTNARADPVNSTDTSEAGAEVKECLEGSSVFLVGMMGTGKSSVGKKLATALGYSFFDTDSLIELVSKTSIPEIFASEGEAGFRQIETQILAEVAAYKKCVVATGGGIVKRKTNWMHLRNGVVVCLTGSAELLAQRVTKYGAEVRPLFKDADGDQGKIAEIIKELQKDRQAMYDNADVTVTLLVGEDGVSEGENLDELNQRVLRSLRNRIKEDDTKSRLKNEPKPGDITVTGM